ncbi:MAG: hypothetical protein FJZ01_25795 [Candidatus Sericytochromatia bacterium]|nr:hypothetical protein [Candidatus Tanganyikabacteria bacterium]
MTPRGGKRKGAGRPPIGNVPRVMSAFSLPPAIVEWITEQAEAQGTSRSELVARILQDARRAGPGGPPGVDLLGHLRSVKATGGSPVPRTLVLPASTWLQLEGQAERSGRHEGQVAAELLALGMAAADLLARQDPDS